jgi:hypothetical protein
MDLEALRLKRDLLYSEAREINEKRLRIDCHLRQVTGTDPVACQRRCLLQIEFDELTISLRKLSGQARQITQQIDANLSKEELWSLD